MAFQEPNYTQVPNTVIDELMAKLSSAEFKCVMLIIRQTFGYHRRNDKISLSYFMKKCSLSNRGVINSIKSIEEKGLVKVKRFDDDKTSNEYTLDLDTPVNSVHGGSELSSRGGVNSVHSIDKETSKENSKKEHVSSLEMGKEKQQPRKMPQVKGKLLKEVNALSDRERKTFNALMEVEPASKEDEYFNPVMACKVAKSRTFEQIIDAIKVYRQRLLTGKAPRSMGGALLKIINDEVKPKKGDFERNIKFWEDVQKYFEVGSFKRTSQGVTLPSGVEVDFIMYYDVFYDFVMKELEE